MSSRCTGRCCLSFDLPMSPGTLRIMALAAQHGRGVESPDGYRTVIRSSSGYNIRVGSREEAILIGTMTQFIGQASTGAHLYTCAHFDQASRNCTIYERRPRMCSDFPYGRTCTFSDCEWDEVRGRIAKSREVVPRGWLAIRAVAWVLRGRAFP